MNFIVNKYHVDLIEYGINHHKVILKHFDSDPNTHNDIFGCFLMTQGHSLKQNSKIELSITTHVHSNLIKLKHFHPNSCNKRSINSLLIDDYDQLLEGRVIIAPHHPSFNYNDDVDDKVDNKPALEEKNKKEGEEKREIKQVVLNGKHDDNLKSKENERFKSHSLCISVGGLITHILHNNKDLINIEKKEGMKIFLLIKYLE